MAKSVPDATKDLMLAEAEGTDLHICSAEPTTFAEATTTFNLATEAAIGGDYAKANGDVSGRKNTLTAPSGTSITSTGTATHAATTNSVGSLLKLVTTTTSQALTSGGTVDIGAFAHELLDVT